MARDVARRPTQEPSRVSHTSPIKGVESVRVSVKLFYAMADDVIDIFANFVNNVLELCKGPGYGRAFTKEIELTVEDLMTGIEATRRMVVPSSWDEEDIQEYVRRIAIMIDNIIIDAVLK